MFTYASFKKYWALIPPDIQSAITVAVFLTAFAGATYAGTIVVVGKAIKEEWFVKAAISELGKNIIGSYYEASFYLGRKADTSKGIIEDPESFPMQIYASENQIVTLYFKILQYGEDTPRKVEVLVNSKPVEGGDLSTEPQGKLDLTKSIEEARSRGIHKFNRNMITVSFRTDPNQQTNNSVLIEAHILTTGIPQLPDMGDAE